MATYAGLTGIYEIDFGTLPVWEADFVVLNRYIHPLSNVTVTQAVLAPTGKDLDEVFMDSFVFRVTTFEGGFNLNAQAQEGYVADKFKITYCVTN